MTDTELKELNERIARWLGWFRYKDKKCAIDCYLDENHNETPTPNFPHDIRQTELLIGELVKRGYTVGKMYHHDGRIMAGIKKGTIRDEDWDVIIHDADTISLAVARAVGELIDKEGEWIVKTT